MNKWVFEAEGLGLPAVIVVLAEKLETAQLLAELWAESNVVNPSTLKFKGAEKVELPAVVYGWDGDY